MSVTTFRYSTPKYGISFKNFADLLRQGHWEDEKDQRFMKCYIKDAISFLEQTLTDYTHDHRDLICVGTPIAYELAFDALYALGKAKGDKFTDRHENQQLFTTYLKYLNIIKLGLVVNIKYSKITDHLAELADFFKTVAEIDNDIAEENRQIERSHSGRF